MALRTPAVAHQALHNLQESKWHCPAHPYKSPRCAPLQKASRCYTTLQKFKWRCALLLKVIWRCAPLQKVNWRWHTFGRSTIHFQDFLLFDEIRYLQWKHAWQNSKKLKFKKLPCAPSWGFDCILCTVQYSKCTYCRDEQLKVTLWVHLFRKSEEILNP